MLQFLQIYVKMAILRLFLCTLLYFTLSTHAKSFGGCPGCPCQPCNMCGPCPACPAFSSSSSSSEDWEKSPLLNLNALLKSSSDSSSDSSDSDSQSTKSISNSLSSPKRVLIKNKINFNSDSSSSS